MKAPKLQIIDYSVGSWYNSGGTGAKCQLRSMNNKPTERLEAITEFSECCKDQAGWAHY